MILLSTLSADLGRIADAQEEMLFWQRHERWLDRFNKRPVYAAPSTYKPPEGPDPMRHILNFCESMEDKHYYDELACP